MLHIDFMHHFLAPKPNKLLIALVLSAGGFVGLVSGFVGVVVVVCGGVVVIGGFAAPPVARGLGFGGPSRSRLVVTLTFIPGTFVGTFPLTVTVPGFCGFSCAITGCCGKLIGCTGGGTVVFGGMTGVGCVLFGGFWALFPKMAFASFFCCGAGDWVAGWDGFLSALSLGMFLPL